MFYNEAPFEPAGLIIIEIVVSGERKIHELFMRILRILNESLFGVHYSQVWPYFFENAAVWAATVYAIYSDRLKFLSPDIMIIDLEDIWFEHLTSQMTKLIWFWNLNFLNEYSQTWEKGEFKVSQCFFHLWRFLTNPRF